MILSVNIWKDRYKKIDNYFEVLKEHGFNHLIFWVDIDNDVLKKTHDMGFKNVVMPPLVFGDISDFEVLQDADGNEQVGDLKQVALFESHRWAERNLELLDGCEYDGVLCTDFPWHTQIKSSTQTSYFNHPKDIELLKEHGVDCICKSFDDESEETKKWIKEYVLYAAMEFYVRFEALCYGLPEGKKGWWPLQVGQDVSVLQSPEIGEVFERFCSSHDPVIMIQNYCKVNNNARHYYYKMAKDTNAKLVGGTEGAIGLVKRNGRKPFQGRCCGIITEEHHLLNDRHPTYAQIRREMSYLIEKYQK